MQFLNMACVFIGAQRISKVVYFCGGILFSAIFHMVFIYEYILCFITNLKLLFGNSAWYRDIDCSTFRKNTHIYRLIVSVTIGGLPFFAAAFFQRLIFSDGMTDYNASAFTVFALRAVRLYRLVRHSSYAAQDSVSSKNETVVSSAHHFRDAV